jgi:Tfp pilus assembly protein PilO
MNSRILPILALLVAIGIFFVYVNPTWNISIAETKKAIANDESALVSAGEYTAQQNELISARKAINPSDLARLTTLLPDSVDNVQLILNLNALAARSGISLSHVDVMANAQASGSGTSAASPINSVDVALSAVGTYEALQTFLTGVEKSERLLDVRDISVKGSDTGVYTYQMTIRLYWLH